MTSAFDPILEPFIEAIDDAFIRFLTTADLTPAEPSDDVMIVHRGYTQSQVNVTDWSVPEATDAEVRWRIHLLRRAGHLIHQGRVPEAGWTAAQLWDLADLLAAGREGGGDDG